MPDRDAPWGGEVFRGGDAGAPTANARGVSRVLPLSAVADVMMLAGGDLARWPRRGTGEMRRHWKIRSLVAVAAAGLFASLVATGCDRAAVTLDDEGADGSAWDIRTTTDRSGDDPVLVLEVEPRPPYRINMEFPWMLGVPLLGAELRTPEAETFEEGRVVFRVPADTPLEEVEGNLRFSVCTDDVCLTPRQSVRWTLAEAEAPGP